MKGNKLSHVSNSHDWADFDSGVTATHSPTAGFGCLSDQKPEYCETNVPAADSNVFVRKSSSVARPNQYLFDSRLLASLAKARDSVTLFSLYESIVINSAPYL